MWANTLVASTVFLFTLTTQGVVAIVLLRLIRWLAYRVAPAFPFWGGLLMLEATLLALLFSALLQIALWAWAFILCGEFTTYHTAFYHSAVNFTTLGYGDIVMSERRRLLGPLEAINGVLMLSLSASMLYATFTRIGQEVAKRSNR